MLFKMGDMMKKRTKREFILILIGGIWSLFISIFLEWFLGMYEIDTSFKWVVIIPFIYIYAKRVLKY